MPLAQIKELKMKRLILIILIFAHTLTFRSGEKIEGNLNNYYERQDPIL